MSSFTVEPHGVDQQSLQNWKKEWLELWAAEKDAEKSKVKTIIRRQSAWDTYERDVPWCPIHFQYCIIDESMEKVQNWEH